MMSQYPIPNTQDAKELNAWQCDMPKISIIIPFFQKTTGLLNACVRSVLEQASVVQIEIIVVDDGSPISAKSELKNLEIPDGTLTLIKQENAGPAAARNAGLHNVSQDTDYVAFIDSDDKWIGPFLEDAVYALEKGYDLFFGNSQRFGIEKTRLEWGADSDLNIRPAEHARIAPSRQLYSYDGDFFDFLVRRSNIFGMTTFAYRFKKFPAIRFSEKLFNGQDRLFKLSLKGACKLVAFSPKIYANEGAGVNIFDKSQWGSEGSIKFLSSYIELPKEILRTVELSSSQRTFVKRQLAQSRYSMAASIFHLLKSGKRVDWKCVFRTCRDDPMFVLMLVPNMILLVNSKLLSQRV